MSIGTPFDGPEPPRPPAKKVFQRDVPGPGRPLDITTVSPSIVSLWVHWELPSPQYPNGRSRCCLGERCPWKGCKAARRWAGYILAYLHGPGVLRIISLGPDGALLLLETVGSDRIRGNRLICSRGGDGRSAPIYWTRPSVGGPIQPLPDAHDLAPSLARWYGPQVYEALQAQQEGGW